MNARARELRRYLQQGGVIAYPTHAVFGLGCDPRHWRGLGALLRLKQRPNAKGVIVVADTEARLRPFMGPLSDVLWRRCRAHWPGPHTWLIPAAPRLPRRLRGKNHEGQQRIALRHDDYPPVATLCRQLGMALVSTSANYAGQRPLTTARACRQRFGRRVRVLDGRCQRQAKPSTIADLLSGTVLRQG